MAPRSQANLLCVSLMLLTACQSATSKPSPQIGRVQQSIWAAVLRERAATVSAGPEFESAECRFPLALRDSGFVFHHVSVVLVPSDSQALALPSSWLREMLQEEVISDWCPAPHLANCVGRGLTTFVRLSEPVRLRSGATVDVLSTTIDYAWGLRNGERHTRFLVEPSRGVWQARVVGDTMTGWVRSCWDYFLDSPPSRDFMP